MCRLLETIKLKEGQAENLPYHQQRVDAARKELYGEAGGISLAGEITVPANFQKGICRCRILYGRMVDRIEISNFQPRLIKSLKLISANTIDYHLKFSDRSAFTRLLNEKGDADEIIVVKNGLVTDCTIGNLVFFDGTGWVTPDQPLLKGTQRQALLDKELIREKTIREKELLCFEKAGIINAFYDLDTMPIVAMENIK
jgi:4-amino-4-deoxychorismate lyase